LLAFLVRWTQKTITAEANSMIPAMTATRCQLKKVRAGGGAPSAPALDLNRKRNAFNGTFLLK
jgi:hypothetical protein